jgi:hypothetical protein
VHEARFEAPCFECGFERRGIEFMMDGVARTGVRELKIEVRFGRKAGACASKSDARRSVLAEFVPGVGDDDGLFFIRHGFIRLA